MELTAATEHPRYKILFKRETVSGKGKSASLIDLGDKVYRRRGDSLDLIQ